MSFLKGGSGTGTNFLNNDKGFFQQGKSFGGLGMSGILEKLQGLSGGGGSDNMAYAGLGNPNVEGSDYYTSVVVPQLEAEQMKQAMQTGVNPNTQRNVMFAPQMNNKFANLNQSLFRGSR